MGKPSLVKDSAHRRPGLWNEVADSPLDLGRQDGIISSRCCAGTQSVSALILDMKAEAFTNLEDHRTIEL